ncbi:MAG: DUF2339 domain-containing protein [Elainellaceae cyanobacterium]
MSELDEVKQQLKQIEARLAKLEARGDSSISDWASEPLDRPELPPGGDAAESADPSPQGRSPTMPTASNLLAWSAGSAFVLAAIYFVKLVYDAGWLTPERQIGIAIAAGIAAIATGLRLARDRRDYAAFLPAVGIVILYIATYAAHAYYQLISIGAVLFGIIAITAASLWLHTKYRQTVYALFAIIGAYSFPLFVRSNSGDIFDLLVYYLVWSLLFCYFSVREARRLIYVVALYFAVIGFDIAWRASASSELWAQAATYQFLQFLIFLATAAYYSLRHRDPMQRADALWHGGALFYFYAIEYFLLSSHIPRFAPYIALLSAVLVYAAFWVVQRRLVGTRPLEAGGILVSAYCSLVTTHVVFFELLPGAYFAWAALISPTFAWAVRSRFGHSRKALWPVLISVAFLLVMGFLQLLAHDAAAIDIPFANLALFAYSAVLYVGCALSKRGLGLSGVDLERPLLYSGHLAFMVATIKSFDSGLVISLVWGLFAISLLLYAVKKRDKLVGQSSLVVFVASGIKVLLYDLEGSSSLLRVGTLLIVGVSLYVGGWLYQRVIASGEAENNIRNNIQENSSRDAIE